MRITVPGRHHRHASGDLDGHEGHRVTVLQPPSGARRSLARQRTSPRPLPALQSPKPRWPWRSAPWPAASVRAQPRTLCPEGSVRRGQSAGQLRGQIVDAMIPGTGTAATEKGELALLVTVDPSLLDRLTPVFQAIGSRTVNAGAVAGSPTKPSHCGGFGQIRCLVAAG